LQTIAVTDHLGNLLADPPEDVRHGRWRQLKERMIGLGDRIELIDMNHRVA
jgi:hypothetical protein